MKKLFIVLIVLLLVISSVSFSSFVFADKPEKITFIHYKDGKVKVIDNNARTPAATCYKLLGVKWMTNPVSYVVNPSNPNNLSEEFITNTIALSVEEWDKYTSKELFNDIYSIDYGATWDNIAPDYKNEYVFAPYSGNNVIAVTIVWGYFSGPRTARKIIEYDILFNTYYAWGDGLVNSGVMDLQNIATHETGHGVGLADLYNTCVQETMYGYSDYGEISKRDLNAGDIAGLRKLYGA